MSVEDDQLTLSAGSAQLPGALRETVLPLLLDRRRIAEQRGQIERLIQELGRMSERIGSRGATTDVAEPAATGLAGIDECLTVSRRLDHQIEVLRRESYERRR